MGLMDRMMRLMVESMSPQEKEEMMLKMAPEMMSRIDAGEIAPEILSTCGRFLNLSGVAAMFSKIRADDEIKGHLKEIARDLPQLKRKMAGMMSSMNGLMGELMAAKMRFVAENIMPMMMPMMSQVMPTMMKEKMPEVVAQNPSMQEHMPQMMSEIMPHCLTMLLPYMKESQRTEFISRLNTAVESCDKNAGEPCG